MRIVIFLSPFYNQVFLFQGFSQLELTPLEAIGVVQRCSHRLGTNITAQDMQKGKLKELLQPEDYKPLKNVSEPNLSVGNGLLSMF